MNERALPPLLRALHEIDFDDGSGDGYDFEPFAEFQSASETTEWLRAWTGNPEVDGRAFLVFGQDFSGGYAAIWNVREGEPLERQPVVFMGSEGEVAVLSRNLAEYVWLLADGFGPCEAAIGLGAVATGVSDPFRRFAEAHVNAARRSSEEIRTLARAEFPGFEQFVEAMCR